MTSKKKLLNSALIYLILDKTACGHARLVDILKKALVGGIDIVQYRNKISNTKIMIQEAKTLFDIAKKYRVPFIINDRLDVALAVNADGIHLGPEDITPSFARQLLGPKKIIGLSCQKVCDLKKHQTQYVDYFGFGPIFKTRTKSISRIAGIANFKKFIKHSRRPVFAIGGITEKNCLQLKNILNLRIAVCRDICLSHNIRDKVKRLKNRISNV